METHRWHGHQVYTKDFHSQKAAINAARKLRVAEIDRLTAEINQLDERYDELEDAEVAGDTP